MNLRSIKQTVIGTVLVLTGGHAHAQAPLTCELVQNFGSAQAKIVHYGEFLGTDYWVLRKDGTFSRTLSFDGSDNDSTVFAAVAKDSRLEIYLMKVDVGSATPSIVAVGNRSSGSLTLVANGTSMRCRANSSY